jgi:hypothetical protein
VIVLVPALKIMGYIGLAQLLMDFEFYIKIQENAALDEQTRFENADCACVTALGPRVSPVGMARSLTSSAAMP